MLFVHVFTSVVVLQVRTYLLVFCNEEIHESNGSSPGQMNAVVCVQGGVCVVSSSSVSAGLQRCQNGIVDGFGAAPLYPEC